MSIDYTIEKQRYLNRARIAFSDKELLSEFVDTFTHRNLHDPHSFPLRNTISKLFYLTTKLSFRQNATQMFRDILEGLVFHNSFDGKIKRHTLFATDIDHPVMTDMAEIILTKANVIIKPIAHLLLKNANLTQQLITEYFVQEAIKSKASIILIPHVNWVNGAKMDVLEICSKIKKHDPNTVTIVDGAQALANVETIIDDRQQCNFDIDFYIGCGQKWMGCPLPIGFARVSEKYFENKSFVKFIFTCDYFSEFAGNQEYMEQPALDTYNIHFSVLFDTVVKRLQDTKGHGQIKKFYYPDILTHLKDIRYILNRSDRIEVFDLPDEMQSGILAVTGDDLILSRFSDNLKERHFGHTFDNFKSEQKNYEFIRFSSPFKPLSPEDVSDFEQALKSSYK